MQHFKLQFWSCLKLCCHFHFHMLDLHHLTSLQTAYISVFSASPLTRFLVDVNLNGDLVGATGQNLHVRALCLPGLRSNVNQKVFVLLFSSFPTSWASELSFFSPFSCWERVLIKFLWVILPPPLQAPHRPNPLCPPPGSKQTINSCVFFLKLWRFTSREPSPKMQVRMGVDNMVRMVKITATPSVLGEIREFLGHEGHI